MTKANFGLRLHRAGAIIRMTISPVYRRRFLKWAADLNFEAQIRGEDIEGALLPNIFQKAFPQSLAAIRANWFEYFAQGLTPREALDRAGFAELVWEPPPNTVPGIRRPGDEFHGVVVLEDWKAENRIYRGRILRHIPTNRAFFVAWQMGLGFDIEAWPVGEVEVDDEVEELGQIAIGYFILAGLGFRRI
jgi:hypothetical protein